MSQFFKGPTGGGPMGNVIGPSSSTDNAIARFDGTTGKLIQNSSITINDDGNLDSTASFSGFTKYFLLQNNVNTADSSAKISQLVGGTSAGDVYNEFRIATNQSYALGVDNSDSQTFKLTTAAAGNVDPSSGTTLIDITTAGQISFPAATLTENGLMLVGASGLLESLGNATDGQIPIGSTGADPVLSTLSEGEAINITNAAGSITIACEEATDSNLGVASFLAADFTIAAGAVSLDDDILKAVNTDGGLIAGSSHSFTIAGGTGITTSGAAGTVTVTLDTPVTVGNGGTGASTLTDGGILLGSGTAAITVTAQPTDGQLLIGSTGNDPVLSTLSAGNGISIANGAGSSTISSNTATMPLDTTNFNGWLSATDTTVQTAFETLDDTINCCFLAYNSTSDANATGDNTAVTIDFDTEVFDIGNNFSGDTFTAPYAGKYRFETTVVLASIGANHFLSNIWIVTSNRTYVGMLLSPTACKTSNNTLALTCSCTADMDAADTAYVRVTIGNNTKTVGIYGEASPVTFFSGSLITKST